MFKKDFVWGVATAAAQIEGGYNEGGRGLSFWDVAPKAEGATFAGQDCLVADDHYHNYVKDVALMKELGVKAYRFSISWSRIIPEGVGKVSPEGIAFYNNLIDELIKNGITPYITLYHWDLPYALYIRGGWLNPDISDYFAEYVKVVAENFAHKVKYFITINEPQCVIGGLGGVVPNARYTVKETLTMIHNCLLSHGKAVRELRKFAGVQIGYAPCGWVSIPNSDKQEDIDAAKQHYFDVSKAGVWGISIWTDPVVLGDYPKKYYEIHSKDELPEIKDGDLELISSPIDFYCQNIYSGTLIESDGNGGYRKVKEPVGHPMTCMDWYVFEKALYWGPKFLYERYKLPFYISENGTAVTDLVTPDKKVHDGARCEYIRRYVEQFKKANDDGVDCRGYFYWSLLDNFEWWSAYSKRFGLIYVDYQTQERIKKDSFYFYQSVIKENGENL
ncbi:MAG: family 1 glycosylhydrolase [Clostridia bacterium]|nr:family 1 glycosylhydrolase [Clostridia bacterium]